jgi:hypothetical protein
MTNDGPLTDDEQRTFFSLLRRVCENHVDQWLLMRVGTPPNEWYVELGAQPSHGMEYAKEYHPVDEDTRLTDHNVPPPHGAFGS